MPQFVQIGHGLEILMGLQRIYRDARAAGVTEYVDTDIDWRSLSPYVVDNDPVKIVPLARSAGGQAADAQISAMREELRRDCIHYFGGDWVHRESPLDPESGYGKKLSRTDLVVSPREVWSVGAYAFTLVHAVDPEAAEASTLSLHFYPSVWRWPPLGNAHAKQAASQRRTWQKQEEAASIEWRWPAHACATREALSLSEAIVLYLKGYPWNNTEEFLTVVDDKATREAVLAIVREAGGFPMEWGRKTLIEAGTEVREAMRRRHPDLSDAAIDKLGNYFSYLTK